MGVYSLAARASELAYILPVVIMNSTLPVLLHALDEARHTGSDSRYRRMLQVAYDRAFQGGLAVAAVVTAVCLSPVRHLLSADLQPVFGILLIHIWASPFVFMGGPSTRSGSSPRVTYGPHWCGTHSARSPTWRSCSGSSGCADSKERLWQPWGGPTLSPTTSRPSSASSRVRRVTA